MYYKSGKEAFLKLGNALDNLYPENSINDSRATRDN